MKTLIVLRVDAYKTQLHKPVHVETVPDDTTLTPEYVGQLYIRLINSDDPDDVESLSIDVSVPDFTQTAVVWGIEDMDDYHFVLTI